MARLSKSSYLKGRQCSRRLWLAVRGDAPEPQSESEEVWTMREREGARVEKLVESLFPGAERIADAPDFAEDGEASASERRMQATAEALAARKRVFQAYLHSGDTLAVVDLLEPRGDDGWFLWEIKASTGHKEIVDWDLAYQVAVAGRAGLKVTGAGVWMLEKEYVRGPALDPQALLTTSDRTERVFEILPTVEDDIERQLGVLKQSAVPDVVPGRHCKGYRKAKHGNRPSACGQLTKHGYCGKELPENWAGRLIKLRGAKAAFVEAMDDPRIELLDPDDEDRDWTDLQKRMIRAVKQGERFVDGPALRQWIDDLQYPIAFFDCEFDTGVAVPLYEGMRPYERLPFQWSVCIQDAPDAPLRTPDPFLHTEESDPRRPFIDTLIEALPDEGAVVVFSASAEATVLRQLGAALGDGIKAATDGVIARFVDMYAGVRAFYYHPDQEGSFSIKNVAPPLAGMGYEDLDVQDGMAAVVAWRRAKAAETDAERADLREKLLAYCDRDAELMYHMLNALRVLAYD